MMNSLNKKKMKGIGKVAAVSLILAISLYLCASILHWSFNISTWDDQCLWASIALWLGATSMIVINHDKD